MIFAEATELECINYRVTPVKSDRPMLCRGTKDAIIRCKFVLFNNKKSHLAIGFRLVSKSVTLEGVITSDVRYLCDI